MEEILGHLFYKVGGKGPGNGTIFYHNPDGFIDTATGKICHYLEAAPNDVGDINWTTSLEYTYYSADTSFSVGSGRKNTQLIFACAKDNNIDATDFPAAYECRNYRGGGKSDWFLPSIEELEKIYEYNPSLLNFAGGSTGYWSSSQMGNVYEGEIHRAYRVTISGRFEASKNMPQKVRPIRAF